MTESMTVIDYATGAQETREMTLSNLVGYRSSLAIYSVAGAGVAILAWTHNLGGILIGGFCIGMAVLAKVFVKDHPVLGFEGNDLYVFSPSDPAQVTRVPVHCVVQWDINRNHSNVLNLVLNDGNQLSAVTFQTAKAEKILHKALPGKSTEELVIKKNKQGHRRKSK